ncbi:MAG: hypothetical protein SNJ82_12600 [Gemmataceae bacterium]
MIRVYLLLSVVLCIMSVGCGTSDPRGVATPKNPQTNDDTLQEFVPTGVLVEHPTYRQWKAFPAGTSVTQKTTTDSAKTEGKTVTVIVTTLKDKTNDYIVLESQSTTSYADGRVVEVPAIESKIPREVRLPEGMNPESWGKPQGTTQEEELEAAGKKYRVRRTESRGTTDAGALFQTVWSSDEIPGGLVKSLTKIPDVEETTLIEITEVKLPK